MEPKKIFLTEEQLEYIIKEDRVLLNEGFFKKWYTGCESFHEYFNRTLTLLSMGVLSVTMGIAIMKQYFPEEMEKNKNEILLKFNSAENKTNKESVNFSNEKNDLFKRRVTEINNLMKYVSELNGRDPNKIELSAEHIVNMCDKYNYSLPLLLAQAHIESHFGTTQRAKKTNSVFSVGSYDDGRNIYNPSTQNESVENYIKIMQRDYLANQSIDELLQPGHFVNHNGHRYASDKNYENKIKQTMNGIIKKFCPSCF